MERIEWLRQECEAQQNALQQTTEAIVKGLTSFKVIVSPVYVSWWGSSYGTRISFEISFVKEDGKTDFGSDIRINFDDNGLEVNYGSCGGFTKYNIYQVERIKLISRLFDHIEDIEKEIGADRHTICNILKLCGIETIDFKRRSGGRAVLQYSVSGQFIARYESLTMAAEAMGRDNVSNIRSCCNKTSTSAYNYLWKYEDDDTPIDEFVSRQKKAGKGAVKMVEQYSLDGEYIQTFSSCREAARSIGAPYHVGINSCCLGKQKTAYGYKWKYEGGN